MKETETIPNRRRGNFILRWFIFAVVHRLVAVGCFLITLYQVIALTGYSATPRPTWPFFSGRLGCYIDFPVVLLMQHGFKYPVYGFGIDPSDAWACPPHMPLDGVALLWSIVVGFFLAALVGALQRQPQKTKDRNA